MHAERFDLFAKLMATSRSRRDTLHHIGVLAAGTILALQNVGRSVAQTNDDAVVAATVDEFQAFLACVQGNIQEIGEAQKLAPDWYQKSSEALKALSEGLDVQEHPHAALPLRKGTVLARLNIYVTAADIGYNYLPWFYAAVSLCVPGGLPLSRPPRQNQGTRGRNQSQTCIPHFDWQAYDPLVQSCGAGSYNPDLPCCDGMICVEDPEYGNVCDCPSGMVFCGESCVGACPDGQGLNAETCSCDHCAPPSQSCGGACVTCPEDQALDAYCSCQCLPVDCPDGYVQGEIYGKGCGCWCLTEDPNCPGSCCPSGMIHALDGSCECICEPGTAELCNGECVPCEVYSGGHVDPNTCTCYYD